MIKTISRKDISSAKLNIGLERRMEDLQALLDNPSLDAQTRQGLRAEIKDLVKKSNET